MRYRPQRRAKRRALGRLRGGWAVEGVLGRSGDGRTGSKTPTKTANLNPKSQRGDRGHRQFAAVIRHGHSPPTDAVRARVF